MGNRSNGSELSGVTKGQSNSSLGHDLEAEIDPGTDAHPKMKSRFSGVENEPRDVGPSKEDGDGSPMLSRQGRVSRMRQTRQMMTQKRKKLEFQPVENELRVETRRRAQTRRGQQLLDAKDVDNKLVQDKSKRMVMCGADVEALYPSLSDVQVAEIVYQAIMETDVGFEGVDFMEGCKYIAMNSTAQECRISPLRRILPTRRHVQGVWPGVT